MTAPRRGDRARRIHSDLITRLTHCVWVANRELQRAVRNELAECDLTWQDFLVMTVVGSAANASIHQQYIGERTGLDRTTIGRILGDLEEEGLVERYPGPVDRRELRVDPTDDGLAALARARDAVALAEQTALARMGARQTEQLLALLGKLRPLRNSSLFG